MVSYPPPQFDIAVQSGIRRGVDRLSLFRDPQEVQTIGSLRGAQISDAVADIFTDPDDPVEIPADVGPEYIEFVAELTALAEAARHLSNSPPLNRDDRAIIRRIGRFLFDGLLDRR